MCVVHLLAATTQAATRASSAFSLFIALATLLVLFLAGVVLIMVARRIRQRRAQSPRIAENRRVDPWKESAKRLQPYPRQDSRSDSDQ